MRRVRHPAGTDRDLARLTEGAKPARKGACGERIMIRNDKLALARGASGAPGGLLATLRATFLVIALGIPLGGCGVNTIPTLEEQAKAKLADVNNQYQRRADLIPNLVETVRGYARQERETLEAVVNARAKATSIQLTPEAATDPEKFKQFQEAQAQLSGALGRLIAVSENYPDLKSNQNFLALQSQLEGTENRISVARRDHIEAVRAYNTELRTFPGVLWAKTLYSGHKPMETFTVAEDVRRPPTVRF
jgi:LemA protein